MPTTAEMTEMAGVRTPSPMIMEVDSSTMASRRPRAPLLLRKNSLTCMHSQEIIVRGIGQGCRVWGSIFRVRIRVKGPLAPAFFYLNAMVATFSNRFFLLVRKNSNCLHVCK